MKDYYSSPEVAGCYHTGTILGIIAQTFAEIEAEALIKKNHVDWIRRRAGEIAYLILKSGPFPTFEVTVRTLQRHTEDRLFSYAA